MIGRGCTLGLGLAIASASAHAAPGITVESCPFSANELAAALAREAASSAAIEVRCAADGNAVLVVTTATASRRREVDLRDVPPSLAPRVLALVASAIDDDPIAIVITPPSPSPPPPPPPPFDVTPPAATRVEAWRDRAAPPATHAALLTGSAPWRWGALGRVGVRSYQGLPLWGGGAAASLGPLALGVSAAAATIDHRLGTVQPRWIALDASAELACTTGGAIVCVGARADVEVQWVDATANDPTVMSSSFTAPGLHAATTLSFVLPVPEVELVATVALGVGSGAVARVNSAEVARLAGFTLGAGVEVRR